MKKKGKKNSDMLDGSREHREDLSLSPNRRNYTTKFSRIFKSNLHVPIVFYTGVLKEFKHETVELFTAI